MSETVLNLNGLERLIRVLSRPSAIVRVGILDGSTRADGNTNASVGLAQEVGTSKIPKRSFLQMPLNEHLKPALEESGKLNKKTLDEVMKANSMLPIVEAIGEIAEKVVLDAFDTQGYGNWLPDKQPGHSPLNDTGQLRDSISYDVKEG